VFKRYLQNLNLNERLLLTAAALLMGAASLLLVQAPDDNNILYVNINVPGGNSSGKSWANAIPPLKNRTNGTVSGDRR